MSTDLNHEKLEARLKEMGYSEHAMDVLIKKLARCDEDIIKAVNLYLEDGIITDLIYGDFSVTYLMENLNMNFFNSIGTIDWLRRSPETASKALFELHDRIISGDGE